MLMVASVHLAAQEGNQLRIAYRTFEDGQDDPPPLKTTMPSPLARSISAKVTRHGSTG
jgi:hypothetical protein